MHRYAGDPTTEQSYDVGQVGDIVGIDPAVVQALQKINSYPLSAPWGFGQGQRESYNINADVVAAKLATTLQAETADVVQHPRRVGQTRPLLTELTMQRIDALWLTARFGGRLPKIAGALDAAKRCSSRCTSSTGACRTPCCWRSSLTRLTAP